MGFIKRFFDFSKPRFLHLDYVDIIVEEKSLFLVSWKSKKQHRVYISSVNKTYRSSETAVVIKVPPDIADLTMTVFSFWRKRKYRILFKKVNLDKRTALHLINKFKPVEMLVLKAPSINPVEIFRDTSIPAIVLKEYNLTTISTYISLNTDKLTYSS